MAVSFQRLPMDVSSLNTDVPLAAFSALERGAFFLSSYLLCNVETCRWPSICHTTTREIYPFEFCYLWRSYLSAKTVCAVGYRVPSLR
ncbi:hypothetical protein TNIN_20391 [Trichonephila inaurata madagascariensis]|uniref:Uncharacterized protein n=1 Tax=Trichonephila inaurata madagascariensis TaxID=2747483 RepID=A0A8X6MAN5_9ARAC|nr:hypothetical protein TNIN_20391 [Trichonephila inaurata madagascariensis]